MEGASPALPGPGPQRQALPYDQATLARDHSLLLVRDRCRPHLRCRATSACRLAPSCWPVLWPPDAPHPPSPRPAAGGAAGGPVWAQHQRRRWVLPATPRPPIGSGCRSCLRCVCRGLLAPASLLACRPCLQGALQAWWARTCWCDGRIAGRLRWRGALPPYARRLPCVPPPHCWIAIPLLSPCLHRPHQLCRPAVGCAAGQQSERVRDPRCVQLPPPAAASARWCGAGCSVAFTTRLRSVAGAAGEGCGSLVVVSI